MEWYRDIKAENRIRLAGLPVSDIVLVPLAKINIKQGLSNQARVVVLDADHVNSCVEGIESGALPAVVLNKTGSRYDVETGNHRIAAAERKHLKEVGAYVIETDDEFVLTSLPKELNCDSGLSMPHQERVLAAAYLVTKFGLSRTAAAKRHNFNPKELDRHFRIEEARSRIHRLGLNYVFSLTHLDVFGRLANDNVLKEMAVVAYQAKLSAEELKLHVNDINSTRTELGQLERVRLKAVDLGCHLNGQPPGPTPPIPKRDYSKVKAMATGLRHLLAKKRTYAQLTSNKQQQEILKDALNEVVLAIKKLK